MTRYCRACRLEVTIDGSSVVHKQPVCRRWVELEKRVKETGEETAFGVSWATMATREDEYEPESTLDRAGR